MAQPPPFYTLAARLNYRCQQHNIISRSSKKDKLMTKTSKTELDSGM